MSDAIREMDATGQAELVSSGEVSPRELVEIAINRAKEVNPEVNAIIAPLYDEALTASEGELPDGPFRGVPFIFKDLGAGLQGQPFHMGNRLLKERDFRVPFDTTLGARFRDAGLVTIGRSNTPEFGKNGSTEPRWRGPTRNPHGLDHSAGGSSGGTAAAVAAGIVPAGHGNDGGGPTVSYTHLTLPTNDHV